MSRKLVQDLAELGIVRLVAGAALLARGLSWRLLGKPYRSLSDLCFAARATSKGPLRALSLSLIFPTIRSLQRSTSNSLARAYLDDPASTELASIFSLAGSGKADLWRDLIVLKKHTPEEKGVILLKYARTFSAVVALLDMPRVMARYTLVLEPCWAGYCDPSILMLISPGHPVIVQCFTEDDYRYIQSVGAPLIPVRLGPADWVDADTFAPPAAPVKIHDLVMVANWGAHKRHAQLFKALGLIRDRKVRVLLAGFPWANRTADDIRREAASFGIDPAQVEILEKVPHTKLAGHVSQSKVFVFLTRKEGDNKALVEAMFANVPSIVYDRTIGGAGSRVNAATGVFASDAALAEKIRYMLDNFQKFSPRAWALEHTGSAVATRVLDDALRSAVTASGGGYSASIVEKTNAPNLAYKTPAIREEFAADYEFILDCRRAVV
jgi:glycosyltransferase involved in cell wall biosynthesis